MDLNYVQNAINYVFNDIRLLKVALTHKSYLHEKKRDKDINEHNERLEFLGDAVLELIITDYLYNHYSDDEGYLTSLRAALVNYRLIGEVGNDLSLENYIYLSKSEKEELGKARLTIVADTIEAILGAIYIDGGYQPCEDFVKRFILIKLPEIISAQAYKDSKTQLQELVQKMYKITPNYKIISSEGKDHEKVFQAGVYIDTKKLATGTGRSKQAAQTEAATSALEILSKQITE